MLPSLGIAVTIRYWAPNVNLDGKHRLLKPPDRPFRVLPTALRVGYEADDHCRGRWSSRPQNVRFLVVSIRLKRSQSTHRFVPLGHDGLELPKRCLHRLPGHIRFGAPSFNVSPDLIDPSIQRRSLVG